MRRLHFCPWILLFLPVLPISGRQTGSVLLDFESSNSGASPPGWQEVNSNRGLGNNWAVLAHLEAAGGANVLAKIVMLPDSPESPKAIWLGRSFRDGSLKVQVKPMGGIGAQRAGLVFRYRDEDNHYQVDADLETGAVSLRRKEAGKSASLATAPAGTFKPKLSGWVRCQVTFDGSQIAVYIDGRRCLEAGDSSQAWPGKAGVWAAPGSLTFFDDLAIDTVN